ncbi:hypothetical protein EMCG_03633 [[Emmonsia] crescens]|uniref:Zinc transporter n=1 Tax=[Emmonsia] crescens TaxID=73230 RepID=A0A0G2IZY1_9EURO|nr:hypothetical protein EMCG_03633 [Emmonsia crescens UAMH 3008]
MDNPVRGGLQPPPPGHRRARGVYVPQGQKSLSMSHAGPLVPPSDSLPAYANLQDYANGLPAEPTTHSLSSHARHYSEIPPRSPNFSNDGSAQANNWDTVNGKGSGSLPGLPLGATTAAMRGDRGSTSQRAEQSATVMSKLVSSEIIAGLLVSAPYLISSTLMGAYPSTHDFGGHFEDESVEFGRIHHHPPKRRKFLETCALVSITMLIMGLFTQLRKKNQLRPLNDPTGKTKSAMPTIRSTILMTISIGLPFYASLLLDYGRVVITMLLLLASGVSPIVQLDHDSNHQKQSMFRITQRKGTVCFLLGMVVLDTVGFTSSTDWQLVLRGYLTLLLSVFIMQPPFTHLPNLPSIAHSKDPTYEPSVPDAVPSIHSGLLPASTVALAGTNSCFQAGAILAVFCVLIGYMTGGISITLQALGITLLVGFLSAVSFLNIKPSTLQSKHQLGFISGSVSTLMANALTSHIESSEMITGCSFIILGYILVHLDLRAVKPQTHGHSHAGHGHGHHGHHHNHHHSSESRPSRVTRWLLKTCEHRPFMYGILKEKDSRRIFYFMCLNFAFMLVQLSYGILTGSLGLLSDSIHMLFDCFALAVGLCAAVMSKWPPSVRFPYGYGKVDTLAGFANGVFLMIISIEIVYEAIERLMSGSEVHRIGELLFVSAAGLAVNMVGIMAFDHGHHHGHSHSHGGHDHDPGHPHPHHTNENMHGIFLHILADTLGSVAVVLSTILVHFYKWSGFDPIASCLIAILIFVSAIPLVASTSKTLLLALPADVEYGLRDALAGVSTLRGVVGYSVPKFWLDDTVHDHKHKHDYHSHDHDDDHHHHENEHEHDHHHGHSHHSHTHPQDDSHYHGGKHAHEHKHTGTGQRILGVIHVIASRGADMEDVRRRTISYLGEKDINILVQVEREGETRCWCGGGNKPMT